MLDVPLEVVHHDTSLIKHRHISYVATHFNLVLANHFAVEVSDHVAIFYLFLGVQVYGSVVDTEFVEPKKGDGSIMQVQEENLGQTLRTVNFLVFKFDLLIELGNSIDLPRFCLEC